MVSGGDRPRRRGRSVGRRVIDRALRFIVFVALGAFFSEVEVVGREQVPRGRPILIVSNHFNGLIDPAVLVRVFGRLPRFLAKSSLWKIPGVAPLCALAGMVPIHRPGDGDVSQNDDVFSRCHQALANADMIGIFPEGTTHDVPSIQEVHTGAARIALGAHAAGVTDLLVVPVGLAFDDKFVLRSRVLAQVGEPIAIADIAADLTAAGLQADATDHDAVERLTSRIADGMRAVSPDYANAAQARALGRAAEIIVRTGREPGQTYVPLREQEAVARRLARTSTTDREDIINALGRYQLDLEFMDLRDHLLVPGYRAGTLIRQTLFSTFWLVLLAVPALLGLLWNVLPYLVVRLSVFRVNAPVTKGTVRLLVALVAFPLTWLLVVLRASWGGVVPDLAVFVVAPLLGLLATRLLESLVRNVRAWRGVIALQTREALIDEVLVHRATLVTTAQTALAHGANTSPPGADVEPA